ncbi:ParB/RepB/Spo0J family partition protein [Puniceibacterium sediminis]|uniref:Chromosome partitioning protein, ParB family n=1 Tax=Puniceibacterium sediminis TaxID=1608407 RepID=A0A238YW71_9RHOB|nr:ParB N-terminal domain-containing protein [Puniceibacterium sediminis]SNR75038.1 chromosome partitioning protein, ParB family [Puniceibacterium sediminis]
MAKRRQLEVPSAEALKEIEDGFARETSRSGMRPPIADVVADAARSADPLPPLAREELARDKADAMAMRAALEKGLVIQEIPVHEVMADALTRDRMNLDDDEMQELVDSISRNGLRLPIEVFEPSNPEAAGRYALISGFRRLAAYRQLNAMTGGEKFRTIPAFVRAPTSVAATLVAMIEENEIRVGLSQYERGRAAAVAVHDGVFASIDEAVSALFQSGSKAKRSKIRSFALIHDELGDMLRHATNLTERQCLRIATALRAGQGDVMRDALDEAEADSPEAEWTVLLPFVESAEGAAPDPSRGGRPKVAKKARSGQVVALANGVSIEKVSGPEGYAIRFHGRAVDSEMVDAVMDHIRHLLEEI